MEMPPGHATRTKPSRGAELAPATIEGWYVLHQIVHLDWPSLKAADAAVLRDALAEFGETLRDGPPAGEEGWSAAYRLVGAEGDLLLLHFREDLEGLMDADRRIRLTALADHFLVGGQTLSVVELGLYGLTAATLENVDPEDREAWDAALAEAAAEEREKGYVQRRLHPRQPEEMPYICFYPMDKRRAPSQNWYTLPLEERAALMRAHGTVGRRYAGRIQQVIGGSVGLADWEWAVTLWAGDPLEFKNIITDMRYDEASAEYAEFGPFFVGKLMSAEDFAALHPAASS